MKTSRLYVMELLEAGSRNVILLLFLS